MAKYAKEKIDTLNDLINQLKDGKKGTIQDFIMHNVPNDIWEQYTKVSKDYDNPSDFEPISKFEASCHNGDCSSYSKELNDSLQDLLGKADNKAAGEILEWAMQNAPDDIYESFEKQHDVESPNDFGPMNDWLEFALSKMFDNTDDGEDHEPVNSIDEAIHSIPGSVKHKHEDVNDDGDVDLTLVDTTGDKKYDTALVTGDSKKEKKDAVKAAKDKLGVDKMTSTGKSKKQLETEDKKESTLSDSTFKNVISALVDRRF